VPRRELGVGDIRGLLDELGRRLAAAGVEATVYIVGGAAIALEMDARRVTTDIDALFHPEVTIRAQAEAMAAEHGLPPDWLNTAARAFVPGGDTGAVPYEVPGLVVTLASPEHLLAMKMIAFRPTDVPDLEMLFRELGLTTAEAAADLACSVYGEGSPMLPDRDELLLSASVVVERLAVTR
jgi:hypothetical protein